MFFFKMQTLRKDGTIYIEQLPLVIQNSAFYIKKSYVIFLKLLLLFVFELHGLAKVAWVHWPGECKPYSVIRILIINFTYNFFW